MITSPRHVLTSISGLCLSLALPTAARADRVIDPFTDALPDQTLPYTSTPGPCLWAGQLGAFMQPLQEASQVNLSSVVGDARTVKVAEPTLSNFVYAYLDGGDLSYATGLGPSGALTLEYGATANLNLDLSADRSFKLAIDGDMDDGGSPRPIQLTITVKSGALPAVSRTFTILNDGVHRFPFWQFSGVSFADVDYLKFRFDATQVSGVDFVLLGGLHASRLL